jgi:preprotein translocase subunit SecE
MVKVTEFIDQVVKESRRISWSSKKETISSVVMVVIIVLVASLFFLGIDMVVYKLINLILNIGV